MFESQEHLIDRTWSFAVHIIAIVRDATKTRWNWKIFLPFLITFKSIAKVVRYHEDRLNNIDIMTTNPVQSFGTFFFAFFAAKNAR